MCQGMNHLEFYIRFNKFQFQLKLKLSYNSDFILNFAAGQYNPLMKKNSIVFITLLSVAFSLSCVPGYIPVGLYTCIKSCALHPDLGPNCDGLFFPAVVLPNFCALKKDGTWQDASFQCQACQNPDVAGVKQGRCTCEELGCPAGETCRNKVCEPIITTDPCFPQVTSPVGCILSCQEPQFKNCGEVFITIYKPAFCAWTKEGTWVSFNTRCQACLNPSSIGVMDGACSCQQTGCKKGYTCANGQCVDQCQFIDFACSPGYKCQFGECRPDKNFCQSNAECKDYEFCLSNICTDNCARIRCPGPGPCEKGVCLSLQKTCSLSGDCEDYELCLSNVCTDRCALLRCAGPCQKGVCLPPEPTCQSDSDCDFGDECLQGGCIDKCARVTCLVGTNCVNGVCEQPKRFCRNNQDCGQFQICNVDFCLDRCAIMLCSPGNICQKGQCKPPTCLQSLDCPFQPSDCVNGICQLQQKCLSNDDCTAPETCENGFCKDLCKGVICDQNLPCIAGQCPIIEPPPQPFCIFNFDCSAPYVCADGFCKDLCEGIVCEQNLPCIAGQCPIIQPPPPQPECIFDSDCDEPESCKNGFCQNLCLVIKCSFGYVCYFGDCIPDNSICRRDDDCDQSDECIDGECIDKCSRIFCLIGPCVNGKCPKGCSKNDQCQENEVCQDNFCQDACKDVQCPQQSSCKQGICHQKVTQCPQQEDNQIQAITCTAPRPTKVQCPVIVYIVEPQPLVCGVKKNGQRISFPRECQACRLKDIVYYFDAPCEKVPLNYCDSNEQCVAGKCVNKDPCFPEVSSPAGCILSCDDESFEDCPDFFITIFRPSFCAWTSSGNWKNYTFSCQACQNDNVLGVLQGPCSCSNIKCPSGFQCQNGQCIPESRCIRQADCPSGFFCSNGVCADKCIVTTCPQTSFCSNGQCIQRICKQDNHCIFDQICRNNLCVESEVIVSPQIDVCPSNIDHNAVTCRNPRPTQQQCPQIFYFRAPDPEICGVKANGERVDFVRKCEACKDNSIEYYFDVPCAFAPQVCLNQEKCKGDVCVSGCTQNSDCPFNWQICSAFTNECLDRCSILRCANCKFGVCNYQEPNEKCSFIQPCSNPKHSCISGLCVDLCLTTRCSQGYRCQRGNCVPA